MAVHFKISEGLLLCLVVLWSVSVVAISATIWILTITISKNMTTVSKQDQAVHSGESGLTKALEHGTAQAKATVHIVRQDAPSPTPYMSPFSPATLFQNKASYHSLNTRSSTPLSLKFIGGSAEPHLGGSSIALSDTLSQRLQKIAANMGIDAASRPNSEPDLASIFARRSDIGPMGY